MRTVWKFSHPLAGIEIDHEVPIGAKVLSVTWDPAFGDAGAVACVYMDVDPDATREVRTFTIRGTGHEVPDAAIYLGTITRNGFAWHMFEATA